MRHRSFWLFVIPLALIATGCASKQYVHKELIDLEDRTATRLDEVETQVEANQTTLTEHEQQLDNLSRTTREALERALAAGKLAEGRFLYETVLTDEEGVRFGFDEAELSEEAQSALALFAGSLSEHGPDVYVEIQGHTDDIGPDDYNLRLGTRRAESVRRYLSRESALPLHRIAVISYGETEPIAENGSREDRARNRRVALVVLK
jgi:outer membrane protein OmpA-like peptidoglycan-associated protein